MGANNMATNALQGNWVADEQEHPIHHGASGRQKNYGFREALVSGMTVAVVGLVCSSQLS